MKSVTVYDIDKKVIIKIVEKKNGNYDIQTLTTIADKITIDIRDNKGKQVLLRKNK